MDSEKYGRRVQEYAYDKLSVVVVGLKESDSYPNEFMGMINTLLAPGIPVTEKKQLLKDKYSMKMESGLSREVDLMCNLSGYVEERGIQKGVQQGIQQGKMEGLSALVRSLKQIFSNFTQVYEAVVKNPEYKDVTEKEVREIYGK